jgi:hypothetical protein
LNQYQLRTSNNVYGAYTYTTDSDLASGENTIGGFYGATPVKGIPTKGNNGTTVLPWLVKQTEGKYAEPFNFKPRLLFKQPVKTIPNNEMYGTATGSFSVPTGSTFYYIADPAASGVRALSYYRTLLATTDSPTIFSSSLDIHYANIGYYPFQQPAVNGQCQDGVYNRYWAYYINSLYDIDARLLTCNVVLNPADIKNIKLNDKIFIDGHLYRINKIQGANLIQQESTQVELIKLPTRTQPFTGRRRVPTGMGAEDYIDVITNGFSDNGSVSYVKYDDGTPVTDTAVLSYASTLDYFEAYGGEVSWNTQQPTNVNASIIVLGNSKYNETQNNVIVVGSGNTLPDNLYGTSIFGDNNDINLTQPTSSLVEQNFEVANNVIMASNASIVDSNGIVLIQPSGSRSVVNSQNNVLLNPINNITSADPTGSVYTGNLRNQGTADFKQGADFTGSVNVTGSFCVNGVCFPFPTGSGGGTGSAVLYNFAFGTDPNNVTFVTIPNPTGSNRTFALEYQLTSGSVGINSGQLQVNTDGNSAAFVDVIVQRNLTGAPTASFTATFNNVVPPTLDVKATFLGTSYIISGSYVPISGIYGNTGPQGPAGPSGSVVNTGSFATTGSNTFIGNQTITGSLAITGSATLDGTQLQFIGPSNSPFVVPNYTITPTASVTQDIMISQSGIYDIDLVNMTAGLSCSVNFYYWLDLIPSNSEAQLVINVPSGSGNAISYRTLVTCSNATEYFVAGFATSVTLPGSNTSTILKNSSYPRRNYVGANTSVFHQVVNSPYGIYLNRTFTSNSNIDDTFYYKVTGSVGTPI